MFTLFSPHIARPDIAGGIALALANKERRTLFRGKVAYLYFGKRGIMLHLENISNISPALKH